MATISAKEFFGGKPATVVGNEASPTYRQSVVAPKPAPVVDAVVSGVTDAVTMARNKAQSQAKKLGDQFASVGENVKKNVGRIIDLDDEKTDDLSYNLGKKLLAGGHIAGDIAATAFAIPATVAGIVIPDKVKKSVMEWVAEDQKKARVKELTTEKGRKTAANRQAVKEWWNTLDEDNKEALVKDIPSLVGLLGAGKSSTLNPSLDDLTNPFKSAPKTSPLATAVNESTTGMQKLYSSADPNIKFDGSMPIPQEVSDHILDDIAMKFERIYKKPLAAEQIRSLAGKPYNSLDEIKTAAMNLLDDADDIAASAQTVPILDRVRTSFAEKNVNSNLKTSATRLSEDGIRRQGIGETKIKSPVETYDEFFAQEQKFKGDAKQDMALSISGERIGNAFEKVVQQRRTAGKTMGEELKKVGSIKTDITDSFSSLETELADQGLVYDATKKTLSPSKTSKVTSQDQALIKKYIGELNALGANPSIAELDAFLSRLPKEVDVYKGKNNITGVTNGERIIKSHLNELRSQLSPEKSGNEALRAYSDARKAYADLTSFLDEGQSFLGKKTQAGDYAKDASLAKSAAISILNNGKKDWLLRLEELTGYPALDEAVLALQAMKDAGNPQGLSLLEKVMQGGIPTSKGDIWGRIIDYIGSGVNRVVVGTPDEQTRAFLRSLEQPKAPIVSPTDATKTTTPKTTGTLDITDNPQRGSVANPFFKSADEVEPLVEEAEILRGTKGLTADDIMKTYPNIKLIKDVAAKDIYGNKAVIPEGEALTPYGLKGNKILLQDGETYIVSKNQFDNIKGNSIGGEPKPFAPELEGLEETINTDPTKTFGKSQAIKEIKAGKEVYGIDDNGVESLVESVEDINESGFSDFTLGSSFEKGGPTKYSQYTLPGGENYREVLIKAPTKKEILDYRVVDGKDVPNYVNDEPVFKSSHWEDPNVISHLRLNERTYNGKKVTFMEELQSDWAREGRAKGFASDVQLKWEKQPSGDLVTFSKEGDRITITPEGSKFYLYGGKGNQLGSTYSTLEQAKNYAQNYSGSGVPNNPLLKNWQELSVKRALKDAVDNDSEYFAWINGEQTSARYNLATHVETVEWKPISGTSKISKTPYEVKQVEIYAKDKGKSFIIDVDKSGQIVNGKDVPNDWNGKKLDEVLGKGLADKIMEKESGTLSGEGLKFGGEWANNLYDKQVKNIIEDLTGDKVETIDLGLPIDSSKKVIVDNPLTQIPTTERNLKVGKSVFEGRSEYIITDVLGDGKFKAVPKQRMFDSGMAPDQVEQFIKDGSIENYAKRLAERNGLKVTDPWVKQMVGYRKSFIESYTETFDISSKSTTQQAIKLTPEIKSKIRGEAVEIKTSGKMFEDAKGGATLKKVGTGDFGDIYEGPKGNEAVNFLIKKKGGEVTGALTHPEIGDIDLVWDVDGKGLSSVVKEHPDVLPHLADIIKNGEITTQTANRVRLVSKVGDKDALAVIRLDFDGVSKKWLLTSFIYD